MFHLKSCSITMDSNLVKCFICDVECAVQENHLGSNIARALFMPMTSVLAKCLRTIVEAENEYFCAQCVKKIEDYDQLIQLSSQIETELYELYQKKPSESCYLLDAEVIQDPSMNVALIQSDDLKLENQSVLHDEPPGEELTENYDDMVVEYLDEYEAQSDDVDVKIEQKEAEHSKVENSPNIQIEDTTKPEEAAATKEQPENTEETEDTEQTKQTEKKTRSRTRRAAESRIVKNKTMKTVNDSPEPTEQELKCQKCSYAAESRVDLEEHMTLKHIEDVKRLVCDICGRSYKSKSALCVHLGMHNGRNSHECHVCGKTFTQRGALVRHMPMHTGEKPHQCDVCGKRFIHYSSFHMHQMIHTNERRKKCNLCGSEFRSNSHMTRHMRSHTGEKPFACPICGQKFAQRYNMKTHYNTHQGIHRPQSRNHKCVICFEAFPRREKLNKHLREEHRISDEDITAIAQNGPDSEITHQILDRLKANIYTKEEILIEYVDDNDEIVSPNPVP